MTLSERFDAKWTPEPNTGCHLWTAALGSGGYGVIQHEGRALRANRVALELSGTAIPDGMVVRHSCDEKSCVNPAHLSVGTQADNIADKVRRNRQSRGSGRWNAMPEPRAREIVRAVLDGATHRNLMAKFGLSKQQALRFAKRRTWTHLFDEMTHKDAF